MQVKHGAYYFVRAGKWTRLHEDYGPALTRYAELVGEKPTVTTIAEAINHYIQSEANRLAASTIEGYRRSAMNLCPVFGHMSLEDLRPADVYRYLTERGDVQANRDRALLSVAYTHARRIGAFSGDDPAKGLNYRNTETPRARYVTDAEFDAALAAASPKLACITRFLFLTGMRQGNALQVRMDDITDDGIRYWNSKGKKWKLVGWSDELRACVEDARRLWRRFGREWLFESRPRGKHSKRGVGPYTPSGLRALWRVARTKAGLADVTLHDMRRKAGSDVDEGHATDLLGHSSLAMTRRYAHFATANLSEAIMRI